MNIKILCVGKLSEKFFKDACDEYKKRISAFSKIEIIEIPEEKMNDGNSKFIFVIGGSFGLGDEIKKRSNFKLSFSKFTLPHQLFRVVLLEQIYRAFKIMNNQIYHK